jgi:hypothetical protein
MATKKLAAQPTAKKVSTTKKVTAKKRAVAKSAPSSAAPEKRSEYAQIYEAIGRLTPLQRAMVQSALAQMRERVPGRRRYADAPVPAEAQRLAAKVRKLAGVTVETLGSWVWVHGGTRPHKETLASLGFRWAPKRRSWYHKGE